MAPLVASDWWPPFLPASKPGLAVGIVDSLQPVHCSVFSFGPTCFTTHCFTAQCFSAQQIVPLHDLVHALFSAPSFSARCVPLTRVFLPEPQKSVLSLFSPEANEEEARGRKEQKKQQRRRAKKQAANTEEARKQRQNQKQVRSMCLALLCQSTNPKGSLKNQHSKGVRNLRFFRGRECGRVAIKQKNVKSVRSLRCQIW